MDLKMPKTGKGWVDLVGTTKDGRLVKLKRLQPVGNSLALFLPKVWVEFMCKKDEEGKYWVEIETDANKITITGFKEKL